MNSGLPFNAGLIPGVVLIAVMIGVVVSYNRFISQRALIRDSWSDIDTELQRRHDLIPNLVATVKGYAAHEQAVLDDLATIRSRAIEEKSRGQSKDSVERQLVDSLRRVLAIVENYPDLKASDNFLQLQDELVNTENRLQAARRFYNANVRDYNIRIQSVPSLLIAKAFRFTEESFFEVEEATMREPPETDFAAAG